MASSRHLSSEDIESVSKLVEEAGELALAMRDGVDISHKASFDDKVTGADTALSILITTHLKQRFPDDCVVSEEDDQALHISRGAEPLGTRTRVWMIDPIDGTQNYILDDGQYCVMIGLIVDLQPVFGWVYEPHTSTLYFGGPEYGAFKRKLGSQSDAITCLSDTKIDPLSKARLLMGSRDRKKHSWIGELALVDLVKIGSIGLKVARILDGEADIFAHLSCKLKTWDTAGPAAIALGAGLEVGGLDCDHLLFPLPQVVHDTSIIMGLPGSLAWCRNHLVAPVATERKDS